MAKKVRHLHSYHTIEFIQPYIEHSEFGPNIYHEEVYFVYPNALDDLGFKWVVVDDKEDYPDTVNLYMQ
jgi:hypothetical protein